MAVSSLLEEESSEGCEGSSDVIEQLFWGGKRTECESSFGERSWLTSLPSTVVSLPEVRQNGPMTSSADFENSAVWLEEDFGMPISLGQDLNDDDVTS